VLSNDDKGQLNTCCCTRPDGRLRLRNLLPAFHAHIRPAADRHPGRAQRAAGDGGAGFRPGGVAGHAGDPGGTRVPPRHVATDARTSRPYRRLGIAPPPLRLLINRVHPVSSNARLIQQALRDLFRSEPGIAVLDTDIPAIEAYPRASTLALPVHRVEHRQPSGRTTPAAFDTMRALACELLPSWKSAFMQLKAGAHRKVKT
jgi:chromosome partitioning related protein ParA